MNLPPKVHAAIDRFALAQRALARRQSRKNGKDASAAIEDAKARRAELEEAIAAAIVALSTQSTEQASAIARGGPPWID